MSEKEKGEWKKRVDEDKARYEREMEQYEAGGKKVKKWATQLMNNWIIIMAWNESYFTIFQIKSPTISPHA